MNTPHYSNSHNLGIILPKIVAFSVQTLVYVPSLSSRLLLRNIPNFFDYYGSSPMCLSSRNRSNSKAFRHILPCIAPVCEGMHYHKTGVPWQMNRIFIIVLFLLILPRNANPVPSSRRGFMTSEPAPAQCLVQAYLPGKE